MRLLVDACNVLHVTGILPPELALGEPVELAQLVQRSRYGRVPVTLVCDGARPGAQALSHGGHVALQWTGATSADEVIRRTLQESSHARKHLVVSSDRAVQATARHFGSQILPSDRFLEHLATDARRTPRPTEPNREVHLDDAATERWLREFGLDQESAP
jgi:predicted RNA-binding protein with PIN domain